MFAAAQAMSLVLIGMDPSMAGAVDRTTVQRQGDEAAADLVTIVGDPAGVEDMGRIAVSHMRFDCKGARVTMLGGFTQKNTGSEIVELEPHEWAPVPEGTPAGATFQFACFNKAPQPTTTFSSFGEMADYYDQALKRGGPPPR